MNRDKSLERSKQATHWAHLMARAQRGDKNAYRLLLLDIAPVIGRIVHARASYVQEPEEIVQDVFLSLHAGLHTYDPSRPFLPWLVAIVHRRIVDHVRRVSRRARREFLVDPSDQEILNIAAENEAEAVTSRVALSELMGRLPEGQREAVELLKLQGLSLSEASLRSGRSVGTLKVSVHRAIKALRRIISRARTNG